MGYVQITCGVFGERKVSGLVDVRPTKMKKPFHLGRVFWRGGTTIRANIKVMDPYQIDF